MKTETLDTIGAYGAKATVTGASLSGWGWVVSNEFFGLMGVAIAVVGLMVQTFYKWKSDRRVAAEYEERRQERLERKQERQVRIDLMRATGKPIAPPPDEPESDLAKLEPTE